MKPDLDDVARVLIAAGHMPYSSDTVNRAYGGALLKEGGDCIAIFHRPSMFGPYHPIVENDLRITAYARALKARGYLVEPVPHEVEGTLNHSLRVTLKD